MASAPTRAAHASQAVNGCLARVRVQYANLTKTERKVADFVLGNERVIYLSILEFAEACGVGYGTIARFCKRIGYSGFQDLKIGLAEDTARRRAEVELRAAPVDGSLVSRAAHEAMDDIRCTEQLLSEGLLTAAAEAIVGAEFVFVAGLSSSAATALEIEYRLARYGLRGAAVVDNHMQRIRAATLKAGDLALLISFSGSTREIIATGEIAREAGARVMSLTNSAESPVSKLAELALVTGIQLDPLGAEVPSRVAIEFLLTALFAKVAELNHETTQALTRTFRATADRQL